MTTSTNSAAASSAADQIRRLRGLRGFPNNTDGISELVLALQTAYDEAAAERFVNDWLHDSRYAPAPADIYAAFPRREPKNAKCELCSGGTWLSREYYSPSLGYVVAYGVPCDCQKQKRLRVVEAS